MNIPLGKPLGDHCNVNASLGMSNSGSAVSQQRKSRKELPPLFWYMEMGDWKKATQRAKSHRMEVITKATLRTKSMAGDGTKVSGTKRLALHHACFKLRSAGSTNPPTPGRQTGDESWEDPFIAVCEFILLLVELYPDAAGMRESRHGCLPLHLAAFASCAPRSSSSNDDEDSSHSQVLGATSQGPAIELFKSSRPPILSVRSQSESTTDTMHSGNMSAVWAEEYLSGDQARRRSDGPLPYSPTPLAALSSPCSSSQDEESNISTAAKSIIISKKREAMAVKVINALLDAYPRAIRVDSEGGRLPLHTACAGRSTPRVISTLVRAYPPATRHRNKDGFLPLHLAAHWGVSHPNVAITLLKTYPDATVGRNRWERTPLEEALCMAGENGRPHQAPLVRALRKHPSYWTQPPKELFETSRADRRQAQSTVVDVDATIVSEDNESSVDDAPRYFNSGHSMLLDDEEINVDLMDDDPRSSGGIMGRLLMRSKSAEADMNLSMLIKNLKWKSVVERLDCGPDEANEEWNLMTRGGFTATSGMTALHYACERKPTLEAVQALIEANPEAVTKRMMPGGCLPLHFACTWHASTAVIDALLGADSSTAKVVDELGNRPIHAACFSGHSYAVIESLLATYPKAILARNNQGSQPIDISKRLRHDNRRGIIALLTQRKDQVLEKQQRKHRRSRSSGSGVPPGTLGRGAEWGPTMEARDHDKVEAVQTTDSNMKSTGVGVEVTYSNQETLLWI